jgi:hypothetical protein
MRRTCSLLLWVLCLGLTPVVSQTAPPQGYVKVPSAANCSFHNIMQAGGASTGGGWVPTSIGSLSCKASGGTGEQDVPLVSGEVKNGLFATKSFGDFFISGGGSSLQLYIGADRLQSFRQFLGIAAPSSDDKTGQAGVAAGQVPRFSPFSADLRITSTGEHGPREVKGRLDVGSGHVRMTMASGESETAIITDLATGTMDLLLIKQRVYIEQKASQFQGSAQAGTSHIMKPYDPDHPCADLPDVTCKRIGAETVSDRICDRWEVTDKQGRATDVWIAQKLNFAVKVTTTSGTMLLTNIREGEPDNSLFKIPDGYRTYSAKTGPAVKDARPNADTANEPHYPSFSASASVDDKTRSAVKSAAFDYLGAAGYIPGWEFSAADSKITSDKINLEEGRALIFVLAAFKGGSGAGIQFSNGARAMFGQTVGPGSPMEMYGVTVFPQNGSTFMIVSQTLFFTMESGTWRMSGTPPHPPPRPPIRPM